MDSSVMPGQTHHSIANNNKCVITISVHKETSTSAKFALG